MAGDWSLRAMSRSLRRHGHRTSESGIRVNAGCTTATLAHLERRLEQVTAQAGPVAIVGHSRGGTLARLLTTRRPDLVRGLDTLGSPLTTQFAANAAVLRFAETLARRNRHNTPTMPTDDCLRGECADQIAAATHPTDPPRHRLHLDWRADGIVWRQSCLDPHADTVEVYCSHNAMAVNRAVDTLVARRLAATPD